MNLKLRAVTGVIGVIVTTFIIQSGGVLFVFASVLLSLMIWREYSELLKKLNINIAYFEGIPILISIQVCAYFGNIENILMVLTLASTIIFSSTIFSYRNRNYSEVCFTIAGLLYIGLPFACLVLLRFFTNVPNNIQSSFVWILMSCTWASDTFAYFIGSIFGTHKLAPKISPNKTIEGFIASSVGAVLTAIIVGNLIFSFSFVKMAIVGFILSFAATVGDLVESKLKRLTGFKDSGFFLPGHGGALDRFDSLLYTAPVFYYLIILMGVM